MRFWHLNVDGFNGFVEGKDETWKKRQHQDSPSEYGYVYIVYDYVYIYL